MRPDTDPVDTYFDFDEETGRLRPNPGLDWPTRVNVRLTIRVFRLNDSHRCQSRARMLRDLRNAWKRDARTQDHDRPTVDERAAQGPYRFVARRFRDAVPASNPAPIVAGRC